MPKLTLVGVRDGKAVVHKPGAVVLGLMFAGVMLTGSLVLDWLRDGSLGEFRERLLGDLIGAAVASVFFVWIMIQRERSRPLATLRALDPEE